MTVRHESLRFVIVVKHHDSEAFAYVKVTNVLAEYIEAPCTLVGQWRANVTWTVPLSAVSVVTWKPASNPRRSLHKLTPRPRRIGAIETCNRSTSPAVRNARTVVTPPPTRTSLPPATAVARSRIVCGSAAPKWNDVPPDMSID